MTFAMSRFGPLSSVLIVSDIDGTLVDGDTLFDFFDAFGVKEDAERLNAVSPSSDVPVLLARVAAGDGIAESVFQKIADNATFFPGAVSFFQRMQSRGARICLLSATYAPIARRIAERLRLEAGVVCATDVKGRDGRVTGFAGPLMERDQKRQALERVCAAMSIAPSNVVGLADSDGDCDFMDCIGNGGGLTFWIRGRPDFVGIERAILSRYGVGVESDA